MDIPRRGFLGGVSAAVLGPTVAASDELSQELFVDLGSPGNSPTVLDGVVYVTAGETLYAIDVEDGEPTWSQRVGTVMRASAPSVVDGVCYVTAVEDGVGRVYAIDAETGETRWVNEEVGGNGATPSVDNDLCYAPGEDGLYALDVFTGDVIWENTDITGTVGSKVNVHDGHCYVNTSDETVSLEAQTGDLEWRVSERGYAGHI